MNPKQKTSESMSQSTSALESNITNYLQNPNLADGTLEEQGREIVGYVTGGLVGAGNQKSSVGERTPLQLITAISDVAINTNGTDWNDQLLYITSANGTRAIADGLARDERTGQFMHGMKHSIKSENGKITALTTADQLSGYLDNVPIIDSPVAASNWRQPLIDAAVNYATDPNARGRWNSRDLLSSDVELVRKSQREWESAATIARELGVDMGLVINTGEEMRKQSERGAYIGKVLLGVGDQPAQYLNPAPMNYGDLLK